MTGVTHSSLDRSERGSPSDIGACDNRAARRGRRSSSMTIASGSTSIASAHGEANCMFDGHHAASSRSITRPSDHPAEPGRHAHPPPSP